MPLLYRVDPFGGGTKDVESLPSFIYRLSSLHCATPGLLLRRVALASSGGLPSSLWDPLALPLPALIRPNPTTQALVEALSEATHLERCALRAMTFLDLLGITKRTQNIFHSHLRWCPACMTQWLREGQSPYIKLIWMLTDIDQCVEHNLPLLEKCVACGQYQETANRVVDLSRCVHCGSPRTAHGRGKLRGNSWQHAAPELEALVEWISKGQHVDLPSDGLARCLIQLSDEAAAGGTWERFTSRLESLRLHLDGLAGRAPPSLRNLIDVARSFDVPLPRLLEGSIHGVNQALEFGESSTLHTAIKRHRRRHWPKKTFVSTLRAYLKELSPASIPPALKAVAQHFDISVGALRYLAPTVVKELAASRAAALKSAKETKRRELHLKVSVEVAELMSSGDPVSRKAILRKLRREGKWSKDAIRAATASVLDLKCA